MSFIKDFSLQLAFIATLIFTFQIFFAERSERNNHLKIIQTVLMGLSILLSMSLPAYLNSNVHMDIRIVTLLLGTLYGGWRTGIGLSALIILYRFYLGVDLGFYTTILTLLFSIPVIVPFHKYFIMAKKKRRMLISVILSSYYCLVGLTVVSSIRGISLNAIQVQLIHLLTTVTAVLFFTTLNETINEMLRKNQQRQSEAKDTEIAFLRSQIKPHFLYNTLNSVAELCIDEPNKAKELNQDSPGKAAEIVNVKLKPSSVDSLSNREIDILRLMADGLSNKEIALRFELKEGTVKNHAFNIYGKLQVNRRVQAISKARELQILD
jgi:DNA-binding CsgD family transcriptional regulator/sensor histidine kinase YesM